MKLRSTLLATCAVLATTASAFYIPGWSIRSYAPDEPVPLLVNKVYSDKTQLQFSYADLPFTCTHEQSAQHQLELGKDVNPKTPSSLSATAQAHLAGLLAGKSMPLNLGEILRGDRITVSDMQIAMGRDAPCQVLCDAVVPMPDVLRARELIKMGYVVEWIVDNLPGATRFTTEAGDSDKHYAAGFKLGYADHRAKGGVPRFFLHNHHTIVLLVRNAPGKAGAEGEKVIVGFEVHAQSVGPGEKRNKDGCPANLDAVEQGFELALPSKEVVMAPEFKLEKMADVTIPYTYSIQFREDETIEWSHRWDRYFVHQHDGSLTRVHWLAIFNSLAICAVLTGMVAIILAKTVRTDIDSYRELPEIKARKGRRTGGANTPGLLDEEMTGAYDDDDDDDFDDLMEDATGWKRLHADVFRPPASGPTLLAPLVGSGMQLLFMSVSLVILASIGVLNPSWRGGFISVGVGLFLAAGLVAGYFSGRVARSMTPDASAGSYRANAFLTAALFPGLLFVIGFFLNLFVWAHASTTAVPFSTLAAMVLLWLGVQVPLVHLGSWYGHSRAGPYQHATRTSSAPRSIPAPHPWYLHPFRAVLIAGSVPFAVILVELLFVLQSLWRDKSAYYYVPGFLGIVGAVLIITVAEVSVVATYVQLCAEDHRWWWRSFLVGAASTPWVFAYCAWYYVFRLEVQGWASGVLFFGYCGMACVVYALLTGTVGFLASYAFVRRIYTAIKVD